MTITFAGATDIQAVGRLKATLEANLGVVLAFKARLEGMATVVGTISANVDAVADIKAACIPAMVAAIGTAVARRAQGFGMRVLYHSRNRKEEVEFALGCRYVSFEELLAESDFLSLHCALTPDTRHILNEEAISQ